MKSRRGYLCGIFLRFNQAESCALRSAGVRRTHGGGQKDGHQGFYPLNSRFPLFLSLAQTRDRRPLRKRGTAVGLLDRRGAQCAPIPRHIRSSRLPYCYTCGFIFEGATQGELPEGQEKVPWGTTSAHHLQIHLHTRDRRGGHWPPAPPPTGCGQTILPLHDTFLFQNAKRYILPEKFMLY